MASIKVEFRLGWLSLLGAAAAAYYLRPTDDSFRPILTRFIKETVGFSTKPAGGSSFIDSLANKVAGALRAPRPPCPSAGHGRVPHLT